MYEIKEVYLENEQQKMKRPVIIFDDKAMTIVGEFLMIDAPLMNGKVAQVIERVLQDKIEQTTFTGQRCFLQITKEKTIIEDLFAEVDGMPIFVPYTIDTLTLFKLINMWLHRIAE